MAKEIDPVEDALIQQAASDCLMDLRQLTERGSVTRFVQSGNDVLRVRVSVVSEQDKSFAMSCQGYVKKHSH